MDKYLEQTHGIEECTLDLFEFTEETKNLLKANNLIVTYVNTNLHYPIVRIKGYKSDIQNVLNELEI